MNILSKLAGMAFMLAVLTFVLLEVQVQAFLHVPALVFVVGLVLGGLWACFGLRAILHAFRASVGDRTESDPARRVVHLAVFQRGQQLAWAGGAVGFIIGVINMLQALEDPSRVGPGLALSLLSLLYGAVLAELIFRNLRQWLVNQQPLAA